MMTLGPPRKFKAAAIRQSDVPSPPAVNSLSGSSASSSRLRSALILVISKEDLSPVSRDLSKSKEFGSFIMNAILNAHHSRESNLTSNNSGQGTDNQSYIG